MIDEMLASMSKDMGIMPYYSESEVSHIYRLCYSALGQWCLYTAKNSSAGIISTSKHNQTIVLNELISRFLELYPIISDKLSDLSQQQSSLSVFIRRVYEETGYLLTDANNYNHIANFGQRIEVGDCGLFFGIPNEQYEVNGLGVFSKLSKFSTSIKDYLIRDDLCVEAFLQSKFEDIDFIDKDIDTDNLEYFNPLKSGAPSKAWGQIPGVQRTIARKSLTGPYYRVTKILNSFYYAEEPSGQANDSFTAYDYRRLYFALKSYYGSPIKAKINKLDDVYSKINIEAHLPNREYYLILLMAWPENTFFDKSNFVIKNNFISTVSEFLSNIGLEIDFGD